jgi:iron complex transport system substrate-binding protein
MREPRAPWPGQRWLLALAAALLLNAGHAATVVDDRGASIDLPQPPRRVVTLLPSLTETVCELGACDRLVGVDDFSNWPAQVRRLPHIGGVNDANIERIIALKPDLVMLSASSRALARLEALGIRVMGFELKTVTDVKRALETTALALGVPGAQPLWERIDRGVAAAAAGLPSGARGTTVYFEIGGGYAASESSHIGELLARLGAANVVPGRLGSVPKLNPEFVVRADPQVIMAGAHDAALLARRPGWDRLRAVRAGRICAFEPAQGDVIVRPGPRLADAAQLLARCLGGGQVK